MVQRHEVLINLMQVESLPVRDCFQGLLCNEADLPAAWMIVSLTRLLMWPLMSPVAVKSMYLGDTFSNACPCGGTEQPSSHSLCRALLTAMQLAACLCSQNLAPSLWTATAHSRDGTLAKSSVFGSWPAAAEPSACSPCSTYVLKAALQHAHTAIALHTCCQLARSRQEHQTASAANCRACVGPSSSPLHKCDMRSCRVRHPPVKIYAPPWATRSGLPDAMLSIGAAPSSAVPGHVPCSCCLCLQLQNHRLTSMKAHLLCRSSGAIGASLTCCADPQGQSVPQVHTAIGSLRKNWECTHS